MEYPEEKKHFWETFKDHIIEQDGENAYNYRRPGTSFYLCHIYFKHGYIIIYGDMGPFVFQTSDSDSFVWASSGLESESYVMSKLRGPSKLYDQNATFEYLKENLTVGENTEGLEKLEMEKDYFEDEQEAHRIAQELGFDAESVAYTWDANPDAQWAYWVLRTFMDKLKASPLPPFGKTCDDCAVDARSHEDGMSAWCPEAKMSINEHTPACMNFRTNGS